MIYDCRFTKFGDAARRKLNKSDMLPNTMKIVDNRRGMFGGDWLQKPHFEWGF